MMLFWDVVVDCVHVLISTHCTGLYSTRYTAQVIWRFDLIKQNDVQQVALWKSPVPPLWWPLLEDYVKS
jgi:hypothetical protein